jgi:hypothetical protein
MRLPGWQVLARLRRVYARTVTSARLVYPVLITLPAWRVSVAGGQRDPG